MGREINLKEMEAALEEMNPTKEEILLGQEGLEEIGNIDGASMYMKQISAYPLLTFEQELACGKSIAEGGELAQAARELLVVSNLRLVVKVARHYMNKKMGLMDLIQYGNIGLMKAADKYDYTLGFRFSTFATWWIRQAISRAVCDYCDLIRRPVHVNETIFRLKRAQKRLEAEIGHMPTHQELADALEMPVEKVKAILSYAVEPVSTHTLVGEDKDTEMGDFLPDEEERGPERILEKEDMLYEIHNALSGLDEREERVIRLRFGLDGGDGKTLEEIGDLFGVTRERIRQIEHRALSKLRRVAEARQLQVYLSA